MNKINQTTIVILIIVIVLLIGIVGFFAGKEYRAKQTSEAVQKATEEISEVLEDSMLTEKKQTRDLIRKSDLRELATAVELYYADYGNYPVVSSMNDLIAELQKPSPYDQKSYINRDIKDPLSPSQDYCYGVSNDGLYYRLGAILENKTDQSMREDNGADDSLYEVGYAVGEYVNKVTNCNK